MNSSIPVLRLGLFVLTGALILGTVALQAQHERTSPSLAAADSVANASAVSLTPTSAPEAITLATIKVRPSEAEVASAYIAASPVIPTLPTVSVRPSEEEIIAARIDPTDRIQILSAITVYPETQEFTALVQPQPVAVNAAASGDDASDGGFGAVFANTVVAPHRLRFDMPYYSFGNVLTHARSK